MDQARLDAQNASLLNTEIFKQSSTQVQLHGLHMRLKLKYTQNFRTFKEQHILRNGLDVHEYDMKVLENDTRNFLKIALRNYQVSVLSKVNTVVIKQFIDWTRSRQNEYTSTEVVSNIVRQFLNSDNDVFVTRDFTSFSQNSSADKLNSEHEYKVITLDGNAFLIDLNKKRIYCKKDPQAFVSYKTPEALISLNASIEKLYLFNIDAFKKEFTSLAPPSDEFSIDDFCFQL